MFLDLQIQRTVTQMSDYERYRGLAARAHPDFMQNLPENALLQLKLFRARGGYIAGGYARAMCISAMSGMSRDQLSDQFSDLDVYFDGTFDKSDLLDRDQWTDCSIAYTSAGIDPPKTAGAYERFFARFHPKKKIEVTAFGNASVSSPSTSLDKCSVSINAIAFKTGSIETVLDSFDIYNCKIAIDGDDIVAIRGWRELEYEPMIALDHDEIRERLDKEPARFNKELSRIGKYFSRLQKLHAREPKISDTDINFLKEILTTNVKQVSVPYAINDMLCSSLPFFDVLSISMLRWPTNFMQTALVQKLLAR